jgi:hypothetical protein
MNRFDKETKEERRDRARRKTEKYQRDLAKRRAAPVMYDALQRAKIVLDTFCPGLLIIKEIEAAISKAEGK